MRKLLRMIAAATLMCGGIASADGTKVRWDRLEAVIGVDFTGTVGELVPLSVGPVRPTNRWRTLAGGRARLDLNNGFVAWEVQGLALAGQYPNAALGTTHSMNAPFMGTIVCDTIQSNGMAPTYQVVDTPAVVLVDGSGSFEGFLELPDACLAEPREIVFLLRHATGPVGAYVAYGAGQAVK